MTNGQSIPVVDITIGSNMYGRISDMVNTPSHVLAEFIDNALSSYYKSIDALKLKEHNFKLQVDINFEWDEESKRAKSIVIKDNAAGIKECDYERAFRLGQDPTDNTGLNEFGMGLKTAALWLGEVWTVETAPFNEFSTKIITFDLNRVMANELKSLPVFAKPKEETEHYTIVSISAPTRNMPSSKSLKKIKDELTSIYRKSLRADEIDLRVNGELLVFEETPILTAPFARTPNASSVQWRKEIDFSFGSYRAKGFIGILKDINSTKNGFVLLRRGRVVVGADTDGRYFPKSLCGSSGTFRYKRIFGELELDGFAVAFNKNDIQDRENLEALMEALKGEIHTKDFDLYNQAEEYRLNERAKQVNKIVRGHNSAKDKNNIIAVDTNRIDIQIVTAENGDAAIREGNLVSYNDSILLGEYDAKYKINGKDLTLKVQFVDKGNDLLWIDISQKKQNIVICKINASHVFFDYFGKPSKATIALLKTMAIANFTTRENGIDSTAEMFDLFNEYIKNTKV